MPQVVSHKTSGFFPIAIASEGEMDETMVATSKAELLQAEAELVCHSFGYLKSMALNSAVKLGIPDIIHRCGGAATLPELLSTVPLHPSKRPHLSRLMKMLAAAGIFTAEDAPAGAPAGGDGAPTTVTVYRLNAVSRLLVDDAAVNRSSCMSPCVLMATTNLFVSASLQLHQWLLSEDDGPSTDSPFMMAHGGSFYGVCSRDAGFNAVFNEAMGASSESVSAHAVRECSHVFAGITTLVDVAGGNGTTARIIADAFPHIKCSVLDLPHVIQGVSPDDKVDLVAGDMMELVPPADAVLLKYVLHNWSDEDCVKILTRCRHAISSHGAKAGNKVIIIDTVVGSPSQQILQGQVTMDLSMMTLFNAKEREEHEWHKMFMEAGFTHYKIHNVLGMRSLIEVHP